MLHKEVITSEANVDLVEEKAQVIDGDSTLLDATFQVPRHHQPVEYVR